MWVTKEKRHALHWFLLIKALLYCPGRKMLYFQSRPQQMEAQNKCVRGLFLNFTPLIDPNKADLPHLKTLLWDKYRQIRWEPIRFDEITNNHHYCLRRPRLSSSCYLSSHAPVLVKAARGESLPSCTLFSNIGKRFMAQPLRRHKIPPSTSYITAQLSACANVFFSECSFAWINRYGFEVFPFCSPFLELY